MSSRPKSTEMFCSLFFLIYFFIIVIQAGRQQSLVGEGRLGKRWQGCDGPRSRVEGLLSPPLVSTSSFNLSQRA